MLRSSSLSCGLLKPVDPRYWGEIEDFLENCVTSVRTNVSIRSPHRSKGRPVLGEQYVGVSVVSIRSPHRSKGRLLGSILSTLLGLVSIRSPHRSKGRPDDCEAGDMASKVSIRSPHRSKGRHVRLPDWRLYVTFQSAPLTEARGDLYDIAYVIDCGDVSIRSPHRSKGRPSAQAHSFSGEAVSIRSPHRSKGRRGNYNASRTYSIVSIRSPHRSKGRPSVSQWWYSRLMFQSAPLTEARGDHCPTIPTKSSYMFQSAPLTEARGDATPVTVVSAIQ